jgi:16S rRNA (cytosine1402-N4)-methyltransferase
VIEEMKSNKQQAQVAPTYHVPVLLKESVDGRDIQPDGIYVDVTFGGGGHSREILRRLGPKGRLYGFDQDSDVQRNIVDDKRFVFVHSNFRYLWNWMRYHEEEQIDGLLADLGVSSHHFDDAGRGFSFRFDAPLDMRMNRQATLTAQQVVNEYSEEQLADVLYLYGELRQARRLAAAIVKARQKQPLLTTGQLLAALGIDISEENATQNSQWKKDAAKLFQALRIEVNHELEALRDMLNAACRLLKPGGRLSVITYHSLEDRIVKNMMRTGNAEGKAEHDFFGRTQAPLHINNNKAITPTDDEVERNPRSRSAKLRVATKI